MQHTIDAGRLGEGGRLMLEAIEACVHCGFCLPVCPTYQLLGEEMDSPRGRIYLMKGVLEGTLAADDVATHLDRCLGCLACLSACPSHVRYDHLVTLFRERLERSRSRRAVDRLLRRGMLAVLPYPGRLRRAARLGQGLRGLAGLLPGRLRAALELLPPALPESRPLPAVFPATGRRRARVALLSGCVQQVLAPQINEAALRVLSYNGVEVLVPAGQGCCGALAMHTGEAEQARALARRNLAAFAAAEVDAIITTAAGCGSAMKEYPLLFHGQPEHQAAEAFAARVRDFSEFLEELQPLEPGPVAPKRVAYHDACHLAHAQGIRQAPRQLLRRIPNLELVELADGETCCGSAGTYNLEQPELARQLGLRKAQAVQGTGAQAVVTGNIGCMVQIEASLRRAGSSVAVLHIAQVLDEAYRRAVDGDGRPPEAMPAAPALRTAPTGGHQEGSR